MRIRVCSGKLTLSASTSACWKGHTQTRRKYWPHNCPRSASKGCNSTAADRSRYSNASSLPIKVLDKMVLFAADNVDHNIVTLDGKGTFHGMGVLAAVTPGNKVANTVLIRKLSDLNTIDQTKVDIVEHRFARQALLA